MPEVVTHRPEVPRATRRPSRDRALAVLQIVRAPAAITAAADALAGYWVVTAGGPVTPGLGLAATASVLLYAGGVTLNDWFDRKEDAVTRPERPIPSGRIRAGAACTLGFALLAGGILLATLARPAVGLAATGVAALILGYNAFSKHSRVLGPANMGTLRGANFLLGAALAPAALAGAAWFTPAHVLFVAGITTVARGEDTGARPFDARLGAALALAGVAWTAALVIPGAVTGAAWAGVAFLAAFTALTVPRFVRAALTPGDARLVQAAVKGGVLGLVILEATFAAAAGGWLPGATVATLLVPAMLLARFITVH